MLLNHCPLFVRKLCFCWTGLCCIKSAALEYMMMKERYDVYSTNGLFSGQGFFMNQGSSNRTKTTWLTKLSLFLPPTNLSLITCYWNTTEHQPISTLWFWSLIVNLIRHFKHCPWSCWYDCHNFFCPDHHLSQIWQFQPLSALLHSLHIMITVTVSNDQLVNFSCPCCMHVFCTYNVACFFKLFCVFESDHYQCTEIRVVFLTICLQEK